MTSDGPVASALAEPGSAPARVSRGQALQAWIRALEAIRIVDEAPDATLPALLDDLADQHGDRPALLDEGTSLSYRELADLANRHARWAIARGLVPGEVVCLLMPNCPDYVAIWIGLTRAGCAVALINSNLVAEALLHSIRAAGATNVIAAAALLPALAAVTPELAPGTRVWVHGDSGMSSAIAGQTFARLEPEVARHPGTRLPATERLFPSPRDRALLIYTSGTTGQPKAANVTHGRVIEWSFWFAGMMDTQPEDRLYDCLPMYHSVGGVVGIGAMLVRGGSVLIRARFSASRFWDDVVDGDCTIFQYIGELCRYLAASPPHPKERAHRLRLACGNGLQGDVWTGFQQRFDIPRILEFYAATEGSVSLYNCEGKPGAIGRVPAFLSNHFPVALIRCDPESGTPLRDAAGLCIACEPDEAGEAIGQVLDTPGAPARHFDGYTDPDASARKLLRHVFADGDRWFRTGDLMRKDAAGYYYFVDRLGDTFRWKGENVATTEVATVLRACPGVTDATVYGVAVPGHEGRAGMAAITTDNRFDLVNLRTHLMGCLPVYAQPLFVRRCERLDMTGTFKLTKASLARDGYADVADPVWFNDRETGKFTACDAALLRTIAEGHRRI